MSIVYPIDLPGLESINAVPDPLIIASPDANRWRIYIDVDDAGVDGVIKQEDGQSAMPREPVLRAATGEEWELQIDDTGTLTTTDSITSSEASVASLRVQSDATSRVWKLFVDADGYLDYTTVLDEASAIVAASFRAFSVVGMSRSPFSLRQQVQEHQGQLLIADISVGPLCRDDAYEWIGALLSLNGRKGTFYFGDPLAVTPRGNVSGAPIVMGAGQSGQQLVTEGWTASALAVLKRGDWIQVGSGIRQRLYCCMRQVNADASGEATIDIYPRLRESPTSGEALVTAKPKGVFRLASETRWDMERAEQIGMQLTVHEAI